eukprot:SAG25_NODE_452_length_7882_cov_1.783117_7_plen_123_part_00
MGRSQVVVPIENGVQRACGRVNDAGGASWLWKRVFIARRDKIRARGWCSLSTIIFLQTVAATPCTASHKFVVQGRPRREVLCIMLPRVVHDGHSGLCISQNFLRYATLVADVDPPPTTVDAA